MRSLTIGSQPIGKDGFFFIGGPCVLENEELALRVASHCHSVCRRLRIPYIFKSSYDKANRTSLNSFRGPGMVEGLRILKKVKETVGVPVLTDVHSPAEVEEVARVADVLQIPAFLARQTDLIVAAAASQRPVNIKKAQFLAPWDMAQVVAKASQTGNDQVLITERGTLFGYNNLVVDMRSLAHMSPWDYPIVFDATHSVQLPGGQGSSSGGQREYVFPLARAAVAAGADGVFMEVHENPEHALCDGPNSLPLEVVHRVLENLLQIYRIVRAHAGEKEA